MDEAAIQAMINPPTAGIMQQKSVIPTEAEQRTGLMKQRAETEALHADTSVLNITDDPSLDPWSDFHEFTKNHEGNAQLQASSSYKSFRSGKFFPYPALEGKDRKVIGAGHNLEPKQTHVRIGDQDWPVAEGLSPAQKDALYMQDFEKLRDQASEVWDEDTDLKNYGGWDSLPEGVQKASVDLTFNGGKGNFANYKKFRQAVMKKDYKQAAQELKRGTWVSKKFYDEEVAKGVNMPDISKKKVKKGVHRYFIYYPGQITRWEEVASKFMGIDVGEKEGN